MATTTTLYDDLQLTHDRLCGALSAARAVSARPEQSSRGCPSIDGFLSRTSRHLHAVDAVLLPAARELDGGPELVHDYLARARRLEVLLAHVKAHEFGSTWETRFDWSTLWDDVEVALTDQWAG
ncbi:MAG: hypothetical protein QM638_07990, partial [Nocardioides sp.]|uniref:hypothetical protein n=1 Tax=Nocardioides sp. TaxID=35761 RepID=UPI0039E716B1